MRLKTVLLATSVMLLVGIGIIAQVHRRQMQTEHVENPVAHDPSMAAEGDTLYVLTTGRGIMQMHSSDLKFWDFDGPCLDTLPDWVYKELPKASMHVWAPDIIFHRGQWHLFYCCSAFGKNTSVIGHAVNKTLNRKSPDYRWQDKGMVLKSVPYRDNWNAIDPNIIVDANDTPWMVFGSFWGGLKLVRLTDDLNALAEPQEWHTVCARQQQGMKDDAEAGNAAVEAPFVFRHGDYYYLFASFDYCCRGEKSTYHVVVGRSHDVTGPYLDKDGARMDMGGGSRLLGGDGDVYVAAGHCSVYSFRNDDYIAYHSYRKDNGMPELTIKKISWQDGWPVVK